jgi:hypothetical protein
VIYVKKVDIQVFIVENDPNKCAKCCKTINVIDRMLDAFPEFGDQVDVHYTEDSSDESENEYRDFHRPVVVINNTIFSHGHVPIIKKLSRAVISILNQS